MVKSFRKLKVDLGKIEAVNFTLSSAIHIGTRGKGDKVYALFLDFARAYPSVPFNKLWNKLFSLGVSGKVIRMLSKIYNSASTQIRLDSTISH